MYFVIKERESIIFRIVKQQTVLEQANNELI